MTTVESRVAELEARLAVIEKAPGITAYLYERELEAANLARGAAVNAFRGASPDARSATVMAAPEASVRDIASIIDRRELVSIVRSLSRDARDRVLALAESDVRAFVTYALAPARRRVVVRLTAGILDVQTGRCDIDEKTAKALPASEVSRDGWGRPSYTGVLLSSRYPHVEDEALWQKRIAIDSKLVGMIAAGHVHVEDMPSDASRDRDYRDWIAQPAHARPALPELDAVAPEPPLRVAAPAPTPPAPAQVPARRTFEEAVASIESYNRGLPVFRGEGALLRAAMLGQAPADRIEGAGEFAQLAVDTAADTIGMAESLAAAAAVAPAAPPAETPVERFGFAGSGGRGFSSAKRGR